MPTESMQAILDAIRSILKKFFELLELVGIKIDIDGLFDLDDDTTDTSSTS